MKRSPLTLSKPQQIAEDLEAKIASGYYQAGALLPSRLALAGEYGVALGTMETAVKLLLANGILRTENCRGTFVSERNPALKNPTETQTLEQTSLATVDHTTVVGIITYVGGFDSDSGLHDMAKVIINSLERAVSKAGATSQVFNCTRLGKEPHTIDHAVEVLQSDGVDAFVFLLLEDPQEIGYAFSVANEKQKPAVFVSMTEITLPVPSVYCSNRDAGYQAAEHLLQRGCQNLLFFAPYSSEWVDLRLAGAQEAIFIKGLPTQTLQIFVETVSVLDLPAVYGDAGTHEVVSYRAAQTILAKGLPAEGIIAVNDACAVGFHQAATEVGYMVGRDYALVGFDDLLPARKFGITSLHPPLERLGQEATRVILQAIRDGYMTTRTSLNYHVVARRSSQFQKQRPATTTRSFKHDTVERSRIVY